MPEVKNKAVELARIHAAEAQVEIQADAVSPKVRANELRLEAEDAAKDFPGREHEFMAAYDKELEAILEQASLVAAKDGQKAGAWLNMAGLAAVIVAAAFILFYFL